MVGWTIDREHPLFRAFGAEDARVPEPAVLTEHMHAAGVNIAFQLDNAFFSHVMGRPIDETTLQALGINRRDLNLDYVSGFGFVMNSWAAEVAAASRSNPNTMSVPQLPEDSTIAQLHPALFEELQRQAAEGVRYGAQSAPLIKHELEKDPTGISYLKRRLNEEQSRITRDSPLNRSAELAGMRKAINTLETFSTRGKVAPSYPPRLR